MLRLPHEGDFGVNGRGEDSQVKERSSNGILGINEIISDSGRKQGRT